MPRLMCGSSLTVVGSLDFVIKGNPTGIGTSPLRLSSTELV